MQIRLLFVFSLCPVYISKVPSTWLCCFFFPSFERVSFDKLNQTVKQIEYR